MTHECTRRGFLSSVGGSIAVATTGALAPWSTGVRAAQASIVAVEWGGPWVETMKGLTSKQDIVRELGAAHGWVFSHPAENQGTLAQSSIRPSLLLGPGLRFLRSRTRNSRIHAELMVVLGLLHYIVPLSALMLIGTIQNVNPRLLEAAMALGAPAWKGHLTITIPLSAKGVTSAFLIAFTLSISSFVVPMILGAGQVMFVSNLIYRRFGELANYPSGSAISIVMLGLSLIIVYTMTRLIARWNEE